MNNIKNKDSGVILDESDKIHQKKMNNLLSNKSLQLSKQK